MEFLNHWRMLKFPPLEPTINLLLGAEAEESVVPEVPEDASDMIVRDLTALES